MKKEHCVLILICCFLMAACGRLEDIPEDLSAFPETERKETAETPAGPQFETLTVADDPDVYKRQSLDLPEDGRLSASFLGAAVLELTGRTGESPWFDFLNQLRRELPCLLYTSDRLKPSGLSTG